MPPPTNADNNQYSTWNRTRRIQMPPFLARPSDIRIPPSATNPNPAAAPAGAVTINMANLQPATDTAKPKVETLFGPPVGIGGTAPPEWTVLAGKMELAQPDDDELTSDIVNDWVKRSKEEAAANKPVATTTLQALVNLKRPSIRLTPLSPSSEAAPDSHHAAAHGLEFDFDADAAQCAISVRAVVPSKDDPKKFTLTTLFDQTIEGGFGKTFKFDEHGAVLELDKLDIGRPGALAVSSADEAPQVEGSTSARASEHTTNQTAPQSKPKRFSAFHFRRKSVAMGPALQVVDADTEAAAHASEAAEHDEEGPITLPTPKPALPQDSEDTGVKVVIRLEALDEQGHPLESRNAQLTYLHILRMAAPAHEGEEAPVQPWVVKVVKREALIGTHTFRLQEIYGLASSFANNAPAPVPTPEYPPSSTTPNVSYDTPATECVLCLSSPREVVLLPCRHLVACRECAINMVEFGAGGVLTHEADPAPAVDAPATTTPAAENTTPAVGDTSAAPAPAVPERPRRKRKAKGWFCPVCRQPYTALLRITTTPPGKRLSEDSFDEGTTVPNAEIPANPLADATNAPTTPPSAATETGGKLNGLLASLSLSKKKGAETPVPGSPTPASGSNNV